MCLCVAAKLAFKGRLGLQMEVNKEREKAPCMSSHRIEEDAQSHIKIATPTDGSYGNLLTDKRAHCSLISSPELQGVGPYNP